MTRDIKCCGNENNVKGLTRAKTGSNDVPSENLKNTINMIIYVIFSHCILFLSFYLATKTCPTSCIHPQLFLSDNKHDYLDSNYSLLVSLIIGKCLNQMTPLDLGSIDLIRLIGP